MSEIQERITEYAEMGCATSWAVDPWKRLAFRAGPDGLLHLEAESLSVPGTPISIQVDAIFAELDRLERRAAIPLL